MPRRPPTRLCLATLAVAGPWMLSTLVDFTRRLLTELPQLVG